MLFNTVQFFVFFFAVAALFYICPARGRRYLLLLASYVFYASWNWKFVPLLLTLTLIDYVAALWIGVTGRRFRRVALIVSIAANLGFLAYFKYFNFLASNLALLLHMPDRSFWRDIVLPLGISFHTFQSISYVVDVYRGQQKPVRKLIDYALFIAFFPQLVAGPIVRAADFFRDLNAWKVSGEIEIREGALLVITGLVKKVVLADTLATVVDGYFGVVGITGAHAWGAVMAFALQIYFDFSGYTDMAIGFARLLGFHFPQNFRQPYLATSITDFWRRWHISLSSWLRDYLYIPLGGNRHGRWKTYRNLTLTMLLGGLWHGANWTFVIWGGYHGLLLSVERAFGIGRKHLARVLSVAAVPVTFLLVCVGWVPFRARNFHEAMLMLNAMAHVPRGRWSIESTVMVLLMVALAISLLRQFIPVNQAVARLPSWVLAPVLGSMLFLVEVFSPQAALPFVYCQF